MAAAFLWDNLIDSAAFVGDLDVPAIAALPLSNLLDPQPRVRARWQPASAIIYVDLGSARSVSCVALIGTTLGAVAGGTVRVRLGPDAGFGTSNWDTGAVDPQTNGAGNGNIVLVHPTSTTGRYLRLDISNLVDVALDIGRLVAGPLFRTTYSWAYGAGEGRLMLDRRDRNGFTGAEFPVPAVFNPRIMNFTLPAITPAEAIGEFRSMRDTLGAVGDALWIPNDGLSLAELNQRSIWGAVAQPGESALITRSNFRLHSRSFQMVERV